MLLEVSISNNNKSLKVKAARTVMILTNGPAAKVTLLNAAVDNSADPTVTIGIQPWAEASGSCLYTGLAQSSYPSTLRTRAMAVSRGLANRMIRNIVLDTMTKSLHVVRPVSAH